MLTGFLLLSSFARFYKLISTWAEAEIPWEVEAETQHHCKGGPALVAPPRLGAPLCLSLPDGSWVSLFTDLGLSRAWVSCIYRSGYYYDCVLGCMIAFKIDSALSSNVWSIIPSRA